MSRSSRAAKKTQGHDCTNYRGPLQIKRPALLLSTLVLLPALTANGQAQKLPELERRLRENKPIIEFTSLQGQPSIRAAVLHGHANGCLGWLVISRQHIAYQAITPPKYQKDSFVALRDETRFKLNQGWLEIKLKDRNYNFYGWSVRPEVGQEVPGDMRWALYLAPGGHAVVLAALEDFESTYAKLEAGPLGDASRLAAPEPPRTANLNIRTQPGNAQVYLNDEFRGTSSSEGNLALSDLKPGGYRLRLTLIGYKEWTQALELAAGDSKNMEAKLEPAGPKPLELSEIEEALKNGISPKRVTELVKQFGVDFALTDEVEQRLRGAGADSDLLLAITKAKK